MSREKESRTYSRSIQRTYTTTMTKPDLLNITFNEGAYTLIRDATGKLYALRFGEQWRDLAGDNLILSLGQEVDRLRTALRDIVNLEPRHAGVTDHLFEYVQEIAKEALNPNP